MSIPINNNGTIDRQKLTGNWPCLAREVGGLWWAGPDQTK